MFVKAQKKKLKKSLFSSFSILGLVLAQNHPKENSFWCNLPSDWTRGLQLTIIFIIDWFVSYFISKLILIEDFLNTISNAISIGVNRISKVALALFALHVSL